LAKAAAADDRQNAARGATAAQCRFGSPLELSRVHWVRPELVVEVKYLAWTGDNLLRQVVYEALREDKPAADVRRELPQPNGNTPAPNKPAPRRR
jgi:ATP-dependent DNA ligase